MQGSQKVPELRQCLGRDDWPPNHEFSTARIKHPSRQSARRVVGQAYENIFAVPILLALVHTEMLPRQRMPRVVDRDRLKVMGIM